MRGRKIMGEHVPYDKVWRTGANPATTSSPQADLKIGDLEVPPAAIRSTRCRRRRERWMLIINKQTGQWGTEYNQAMDLGRTPMKAKTLAKPQEVMSISFENTKKHSTN